MSRLMDDLNKLNETRKVDSGIIVQDVEEISKNTAPVAHNRKTVYFIGFLIFLIAALSAVSMAVSFRTILRIEAVEGALGSTSEDVSARFKNSDMIAAALLKTSRKQGGVIKDLQALVAQQDEKQLKHVDSLKAQDKELKAAIRGNKEEIEDMIFAQKTFQASVEDSIQDLKASDELLQDKQILLDNKVRDVVDKTQYLFGSY